MIFKRIGRENRGLYVSFRYLCINDKYLVRKMYILRGLFKIEELIAFVKAHTFSNIRIYIYCFYLLLIYVRTIHKAGVYIYIHTSRLFVTECNPSCLTLSWDTYRGQSDPALAVNECFNESSNKNQ